ncbi:HEAT repeat domain-containing protein [Polyangium jinanense]|uniref:HEAT repeat domain-containing protein n=1 Tax=Polyangium jinanense TaxID=2829994 RepID=A0A9X3XGB1_9BACT|nr:HEAT repeat domain-containing protein [Polyangium jinanense]MDC3961233.1 HEAT repeat domain-containing protein [Polyangium jinanense]MDC3988573.1 HEAT repeat domain-containing protein [Polyangium jinanense]
MSGRPVSDLREEARTASSRGDLGRARISLVAALGQTIAREEEYAGAVRDLREVLVAIGDLRGALTLDWYTGSEKGQRDLVASGRVPGIDRARTYLAWADRAEDASRKQALYAKAADEYESAGLVAQAAIARERGGDLYRARALWSRLSQILGASGGDFYAAGLARFNLARTSMRTGEPAAAREAVVAAVHLLEEAADRYETIGQRERAFDCYQVLIAIGRESGEFEHVLEGYVNVIRILREDHLRYYALQSYEEALSAAEKQKEVSAAATLAREMSAYARKEGLPAVANFGTLAQARLWQEVAAASTARGAPPSIAENALLAAVIALGEAGQYGKVGQVYEKLAALDLEEARRKHYTNARKRYVEAQDLRIESQPLPAHLRHEVGFPEVWHVDLVEWEQRGSASQSAGDVVLDPSAWSEVTRRRAMLARLTALAIEAEEEASPGRTAQSQLYSTLAEQLALVELYTILSPLEALFRRPEREVRIAVVRALSRFLYKRTFITLREALVDAEGGVVQEAAKALEELRFPHAFDPLARIYRESQSPVVRASAVKALARIDTLEAAEMLLGVIEHDGRDERQAAIEALKRARGMKFVDVAKSSLPGLSSAAQSAVREVLRSRGIG